MCFELENMSGVNCAVTVYELKDVACCQGLKVAHRIYNCRQ